MAMNRNEMVRANLLTQGFEDKGWSLKFGNTEYIHIVDDAGQMLGLLFSWDVQHLSDTLKEKVRKHDPNY